MVTMTMTMLLLLLSLLLPLLLLLDSKRRVVLVPFFVRSGLTSLWDVEVVFVSRSLSDFSTAARACQDWSELLVDSRSVMIRVNNIYQVFNCLSRQLTSLAGKGVLINGVKTVLKIDGFLKTDKIT
jgi:hypothetical protein